MKAKTDGYHDCLIVWETIWASTALSSLKTEKEKGTTNGTSSSQSNIGDSMTDAVASDVVSVPEEKIIETLDETQPQPINEETAAGTSSRNSSSTSTASQDKVSESPKSWNGGSEKIEKLTEVQLYVLCICLSIIRRERDLIMARQYDACETLKHFNTLHLNDSLKDILLHASNIWFWLKNDGGEEQLYAPEVTTADKRHDSGGEDFDLLNDEFMLISTMNV